MIYKKFLPIFFCLFFVNCADKMKDVRLEQNPEKLFEEAEKALKAEKYEESANKYNEYIENFPAASNFRNAVLARTESYYKSKKYIDAVVSADEFLIRFPEDKRLDKIHFIKGMSYFEEINNTTADVKNADLSFEEMHIILTQYPNSSYREQAEKIYQYLRNLFANENMVVGRYYYRTNNPIAAIRRFKNVTNNFSDTIFYPEALYRMTTLYRTIGMKKVSDKYLLLLRNNYKDTIWYKKAVITKK